MVIFWIATILSFIGNTFFTLSSLFNSKKLSVAMQTTNHFLSTIAQLLQRAFSGMVQDVVSLFKNLILLFVPDGKKMAKIIISLVSMAVGVGLGITLNVLLSGNAWYGYLPIVSSLLLSITVLVGYVCNLTELKRILIMKGGLIINGILWGTYGIFIKLYPVTIFNCLTIVLSIVAITKFLVSHKKSTSLPSADNDDK